MSFVEVERGGVVESRHRVHVVVADDAGRVLTSVGEPSRTTFYRSAAKPMQALPLVEEGVADRFGIEPPELALCCASHQGQSEHVAAARSVLSKAGAEESLLRCGPHPPFDEAAAAELVRRGAEPLRVHNNCSGKHAGMIALALGMGWDPADYHVAGHPVQERMRTEISRWSGVRAEHVGSAVDGCGVVCFAVPLSAIAASFARFGAAAARGEGAAPVVAAMTAHPFMVGGTGRTCTDVMARAPHVFVKLGAEGVYGGGAPARGLGFAIKVEDGGRRAVEVALLHVLASVELLDDDDLHALRAHARPTVRNTRGEEVGSVRPAFDLPDRTE